MAFNVLHHPVIALAFFISFAAAPASSFAQTLTLPTASAPKPVTDKAPAKPPKYNFLSAAFLAHPDFLMPAPPKPDLKEAREEIATLKAMQAAASPERIAKAAVDDKNETVWAFADVLPGFDAAKLPMTDKLFKAARYDEDHEGSAFKVYFARERPYDVDHTLKTCVPSTYDAPLRSYPSGHATLVYSLGPILASLIPEKADAIMARAKEYAENRLICGVHFPSDLVAGQALGAAIAVEFMHSAAFKADYDAAKAELVKAGFTKAAG